MDRVRRTRIVTAIICVAMLLMPEAMAGAVTPSTRLWLAKTDGDSVLQAVATGPDGTVFATGNDYTGFLTIAYDPATGMPAWTMPFAGVGGEGATSIAVSPDGSIVVAAGFLAGANGHSDFVTVAYDATTGQELWSKRYDRAGGPDVLDGLAISADGTAVVVVGGAADSAVEGPGGFHFDMTSIAYEIATGARRWMRRYVKPGFGTASDVAVTPSGSAIVTGWAGLEVDAGSAAVTTSYDLADGHVQWRHIEDGSDSDVPYGVAVSPDGAIAYVVGRIYSAAKADDFTTWALDAATGDGLWARSKNGPSDGYDDAREVVAGGGAVYVTGYLEGQSGTDAFTIAYDPAGVRLWSKTFDGTAHVDDLAWDIALSSDGSKVAITGSTTGSSQPGPQGLTIVYRASTGRARWSKTFDGNTSDSDLTYGIAIAPDVSAVYVGGTRDLRRGITIAYAA